MQSVPMVVHVTLLYWLNGCSNNGGFVRSKMPFVFSTRRTIVAFKGNLLVTRCRNGWYFFSATKPLFTLVTSVENRYVDCSKRKRSLRSQKCVLRLRTRRIPCVRIRKWRDCSTRELTMNDLETFSRIKISEAIARFRKTITRSYVFR